MIGQDTIAALATPRGRGGVAVVRVSGADAFLIAEKITGRAVSKGDAGRFFHVNFSYDGKILDDGLLLVFSSPRSYTGENVVEFQTHGGEIAPRRVLEATLASGARLARRGEFTQRAFLNGRLDLSQAEAVIDLIDARTQRSADEAVGRLKGALVRPFENLYDEAIDVSSRIEHALDFDESELPDEFHKKLNFDLNSILSKISSLLSTAREGKLLREGALVVLAGKPNAGKSSLMNALLGENRVIVSDIPGTTRDSIEEMLEIKGWPVRLLDTAGLRDTSDTIEAEGVERSEKLISQADIVLVLSEDENGFELASNFDSTKVICVQTKIDLHSGDVNTYEGIKISSVSGEGLESLKNHIAEKLEVLSSKEEESSGADVTTRQVECLGEAFNAFTDALNALEIPEYVIAANETANGVRAIGRLLGKVYSEDLLDALFSRFCIGK